MSEDGNLWCQEVDCPAGTLPQLMRYGDYLGDLKILELKRVLLAATIYKVERGFGKETEVFLMKMANPSPENERYVCQEAAVIRSLTEQNFAHNALPKWRHHGAANGQDAFGVATVGEQTRFYYLMEYVEGEFLFDILLDNPQPWHEHVGWFMISLCEAVYNIQKLTGKLHLNINPDMLLVQRNNAGVLQPVLLDMGLQIAPETPLSAEQSDEVRHYLLPAYTHPILVTGGVIPARADVFGLSLILYEMLAGKPSYPYVRRRTEDIYRAMRQLPPPLERVDLPSEARYGRKQKGTQSLLAVLQNAINNGLTGAYKDVSEFRQALYDLYGDIEVRKEFRFKSFLQRTSAVIIGAVLVGFLLYLLVVFVTAVTR